MLFELKKLLPDELLEEGLLEDDGVLEEDKPPPVEEPVPPAVDPGALLVLELPPAAPPAVEPPAAVPLGVAGPLVLVGIFCPGGEFCWLPLAVAAAPGVALPAG